MTAQDVANSLNALCKWPQEQDCQHAAILLAARLKTSDELRGSMSAQEVANSLNALCKWPQEQDCQDAALELAKRLQVDDDLRGEMNAQEVANSRNVLCKWPQEQDCQDAARQLAVRLKTDDELRGSMNAQNVANSLNALSKWPSETECRQAIVALAEGVGEGGGLPWREFDMIETAPCANALARLVKADEDDEPARLLALNKLNELAGHLDSHRQLIANAAALSIGVLLKSLASVQLHRSMRPLAVPAMVRLQQLCLSTQLRQASLETMGLLYTGLLPLARSPDLRRQRRRALALLDQLQPIVNGKIQEWLKPAEGGQAPAGDTAPRPGSDESRAQEDDFSMRRPGLSLYLVLKTYETVAGLWKKGPHIDAPPEQIKARRAQLHDWVGKVLRETREAILEDLQEAASNVIAQIEAGDDVLNAVDERMLREAPQITANSAPTAFELDQKHEQMRTDPGQVRQVARPAGATPHVQIDM